MALAEPLMWGQGNLCEVLGTQGQRGPSICETLPLPGGTSIKRGVSVWLAPQPWPQAHLPGTAWASKAS